MDELNEFDQDYDYSSQSDDTESTTNVPPILYTPAEYDSEVSVGSYNNSIQPYMFHFDHWLAFVDQHPNTPIQLSPQTDIKTLIVEIGYTSTDPTVQKKIHALQLLFESEFVQENVTELYINDSYVRNIPDNIRNITGLQNLYITNGPRYQMRMDMEDGLTKFQYNTHIQTIEVIRGYLPTLQGIGSFPDLSSLIVKDSGLETLSNEFYTLRQLQWVNLESNLLEALSSKIWELPTCRSLLLSYNELVRLPDVTINRNRVLTHLELKGNDSLDVIPDSLRKLEGLTSLTLRGCGIDQLTRTNVNYFRSQFFLSDNTYFDMEDTPILERYFEGDSLLEDYVQAFFEEYTPYYSELEPHPGDETVSEYENESETDPPQREMWQQRTLSSPLRVPSWDDSRFAGLMDAFTNNPTLNAPPTAQAQTQASNVMRLAYTPNTDEEGAILTRIIELSTQVTIQDAKYTIDESQMGYYAIGNENIRISDFLRENNNHVAIRLNDSYYLTKRDDVRQAYMDCIFYKCLRAGNTSEFIMDENIVTTAPLFDFKKLGIPLQYFYQINVDLMFLFVNVQHFIVLKYIDTQTQAQEILASTISKYVYDGQTSVSGNHCATGQGGLVYALVPTTHYRAPPSLLEEAAGLLLLSSEPNEEEEDAEEADTKRRRTEETFNAVVVVKGNPQTFPITDTTTVEEVIQMMAATQPPNSQIRLLFSGRYLDLTQVISQITGYEKGSSTLLSVIRPPPSVGGFKRTRRRKWPYSRKTRRFSWYR